MCTRLRLICHNIDTDNLALFSLVVYSPTILAQRERRAVRSLALLTQVWVLLFRRPHGEADISPVDTL
jgi:hypothetical protein